MDFLNAFIFDKDFKLFLSFELNSAGFEENDKGILIIFSIPDNVKVCFFGVFNTGIYH